MERSGTTNLCIGEETPSPPSEEGGVTAYKGLKRRDGRRDTPSVCKSSRCRRELIYNDTCITLCMSTPWCKQQPRVLSPSVAPLNPLGAPALPPRRSPLVLRLFALALADGSGLPFSLHPPPAALESQTPQREARALPRRARNLQRCKPRLSLPGRAALIRHGAAPHRATFPKGKAKAALESQNHQRELVRALPRRRTKPCYVKIFSCSTREKILTV